MKSIFALCLSALLVACGSDHTDRADADQVFADYAARGQSPDADTPQVGLGLTDAIYTLSRPDSYIECLAIAAGDKNCRLVANAVLAANTDGLERSYLVQYDNSCKFEGVDMSLRPEQFLSGIFVTAQAADEGDVAGLIYMNRAGSFVIRGKGDLRLIEPARTLLGQVVQKGCALTVTVQPQS